MKKKFVNKTSEPSTVIRHFLLHYLSNSNNNLEKTRKSRLRKVTNLSLENPSSHIKVSN